MAAFNSPFLSIMSFSTTCGCGLNGNRSITIDMISKELNEILSKKSNIMNPISDPPPVGGVFILNNNSLLVKLTEWIVGVVYN